MKSEQTFSHKLKSLFTGRRSFKKRLLLVLFPAFTLSFTLFFFGPLDLSYVSRNYVNYTALEILPYTAAITAVCCAILTLIGSVPGGKIHAFIVSAYSGISLAMYLQGAFLNPDFGTLDGHTVNWPSFSTKMLINVVIWFFILLIPHFIHYFSNKVWRKYVTLLSITLVLMQAVSLSVKLIDQHNTTHKSAGEYYFSTENMLKVGKNNNILVFLLDTTSNDDLDDMLEKYPESTALLHDFTRYDNANSHYMFTVPSLVNLLTGQEWDCENERIADYLNNAWQSEEASLFYKRLKEQGYEKNAFMLLPEAANDASVLSDVFSNLKLSGNSQTLNRSALQKLYELSFYRYFPVAMKPFFVIYTTDITNMFILENAMRNEWDFVERMNESTISIGNYENAFFFYYLAGTHLPYRMDDRGRMITSDLAPEFLTNYSEKEDQLAGFIYLISDYIRQLKENNLYDQTGIIILADHGNNADQTLDHQPVYIVKMPGEIHDSMQLDSAPITVQDSFMADIMSMTGNEWQYGIPSSEVPDDPVERWTRIYDTDSNYPDLPVSDYNVMREYHYTGDGNTLIDQWTSGVYETYPMIDSYY